jgi:hypothetical protein
MKQDGKNHTPGSWSVEQNRGQPSTAIGEPVAVVGGEATGEDVEFVVGRTCDFGPHGTEQTTANARLIAAAPDLLAVCQEIADRYDAGVFGDGDWSSQPWARLRKAITKATSGRIYGFIHEPAGQ